MKYLIFTALACISLVPFASGQTAKKATAGIGTGSEEQLKQIDHKWLDAERRYECGVL